mgnify:FL=1
MNIKDYIQFLKLNVLFKDFSSKELSAFFADSNYTIAEYKRNSIVHFESEKCSTMDIILIGEVIIQRIDEKGNILTVAQFNAGNNIGGNLLFSHYPFYPMTVVAKSDTTILHINKDLVLQLCQNNKNFLLEFLKCISYKSIILTNKIKSISMKSIRESIIDFLNYEYYSQKNSRIKLNITKKELAERLGIQRTSLSRELNKMRKDGLVSYDANSITIEDFSIIKSSNN